MRKYLKLDLSKSLYLGAIILSWLVLIFAKEGLYQFIETLPLTLTLFWMGTGCLMSFFFFHGLMGIKDSPWRIKWRGFPMAICGLCAYHLYFLHETLMSQNNPYFFTWVPLLYWLASLIFYGRQRKVIFFRLIAITTLALFLLRKGQMVSIIASVFLVIFGLMAFRRRENSIPYLIPGVLLEIIVSGVFSFFHWQDPGSVCLKEVYGVFGGGFALGFSLLIFIEGFQYFNAWSSLIPIATVVLTGLYIPLEGSVMILFSLLTLFFAIGCLKIAKKRGPKVLLIHPPT